jgi:SagB-type dehydrogenase family enzyme
MIPARKKLSRRDFLYTVASTGLGGPDRGRLRYREGNGAKQRSGGSRGGYRPGSGGNDCAARTPAGEMSLEAAVAGRRSERSFRAAPLKLEQLAQLLWAAQGITDPHPDPAQRFRRAAPSAGAQYPLDLYPVVGEVTGLEAGIYRYHPQEHALDLLTPGDRRRQLARACLGQMFIAAAPVAVVIAATYDRITDRYGERGIRYAHMEVGHVGQNIHLQAEVLGLGTVVVGAFQDEEVAEVLQLPREQAPLYVMPVGVIQN